MEKGKRPRWAVKLIALASTVTMITSTSQATSLIIDVEADRIIIVADSRAGDANSTSSTTRDDQCKIVVLGGQFAFAETGREGYTRDGVGDTVPEFHGTTEALRAYSSVPDHDLYKVALSWATQLANNFQVFYVADPQRVRALALAQGTLLLGFFAGHDGTGALKVYVARIAIDDTLPNREQTSIPLGYAVDEFPPKGVGNGPYSTHAITQELIDGKTDRAVEVARLWAKKSRHIPIADRTVRRLEFLIEQTGNYDDTVHGPTNAVQVTTSSATWLKHTTCPGRRSESRSEVWPVQILSPR
jgi:hypothetical protein